VLSPPSPSFAHNFNAVYDASCSAFLMSFSPKMFYADSVEDGPFLGDNKTF